MGQFLGLEHNDDQYSDFKFYLETPERAAKLMSYCNFFQIPILEIDAQCTIQISLKACGLFSNIIFYMCTIPAMAKLIYLKISCMRQCYDES